MEFLCENEVKKAFEEYYGTGSVLEVCFKKVKVLAEYRWGGRTKLPSGKRFSCFRAGQAYDMWVVTGMLRQQVVFVPGMSEGLIVDAEDSEDFSKAPNSNEVCIDGVSHRLIQDFSGQKMLVPDWTLYGDEVETQYGVSCAYRSAEMVIEKDHWYVGWAFYQYLDRAAYPDRRPKWSAFFRLDTQKFVSPEECEASYEKIKITLSGSPVKIGNLRILFAHPDTINFEFD